LTELLLVGLNHERAPVEIREALAFQEERKPNFLHNLVSNPGVNGAVLLSTCNRVEVYAEMETASADAVLQTLAAFSDTGGSLSPELFYVKKDRDAVRHIFRVSCGLDSMVLGEPQILGQVKEAYFLARNASVVTTSLNLLFQKAFHVAKQVRTKSGLGRGPVTVSYAAFNLAQGIFQDLSSKAVLLLGSGEMSRILATHFKEHGVRRMIVANRTPERGEAFARQFGAEAVAWGEFPKAMIHSDIVVCSTASQRPVVHRPMVETVMKMRRWASLFIIDIAVPRDVEEEVGELNGVYLYNIDNLQSAAQEGLESRRQRAAEAEGMIDSQLEYYSRFLEHRRLSSLIEGLVEWVSSIEDAEVEEALRKLKGIGPEEEEIVKNTVRRVVHKLIHSPITQVKKLVIEEDADQAMRFFREFFHDAFSQDDEDEP